MAQAEAPERGVPLEHGGPDGRGGGRARHVQRAARRAARREQALRAQDVALGRALPAAARRQGARHPPAGRQARAQAAPF